MKRPAIAVALALTLLLPIIFMSALIALARDEVAPSEKALDEVPPDLLPIYMAAAGRCDGLDWTVLAAIHKLETNFGRGRAESSKGAQGPMQFMPPTWDAYGVDGDGDGLAEVNDVEDAIFSATNLLCTNGAGDPARLATAIWNYNHSDDYVTQVLELATSYGVIATGVTSASQNDVLTNPRIVLTSNARADVKAGVVDGRVLALLQTISGRFRISVSVFKAGHSKYVAGTNSISNHYYGRAADISSVNGVPVSSSNLAAREVVTGLSLLQGRVRPTEVGHPFSGFLFTGGFTDADHHDHLHIGFD